MLCSAKSERILLVSSFSLPPVWGFSGTFHGRPASHDLFVSISQSLYPGRQLSAQAPSRGTRRPTSKHMIWRCSSRCCAANVCCFCWTGTLLASDKEHKAELHCTGVPHLEASCGRPLQAIFQDGLLDIWQTGCAWPEDYVIPIAHALHLLYGCCSRWWSFHHLSPFCAFYDQCTCPNCYALHLVQANLHSMFP